MPSWNTAFACYCREARCVVNGHGKMNEDLALEGCGESEQVNGVEAD